MKREYIETIVAANLPANYAHLCDVVSDGIEASTFNCPEWILLTSEQVSDALRDVLENDGLM